MRRTAAPLAALLALAGGPRLWAQSPTPSPESRPTFEARIEAVSVTAVILDRDGHPLHGLTRANMELREDGVIQDLTVFEEAGGSDAKRIPLTVVLTLDTSGSMREDIALLREAAGTFLGRLQDGDRAMVVQFNDAIKRSSDFTTDMDRLERTVAELQAWGETSLYDAAYDSLERVRSQPGRKAVLIFSDGADNSSRRKAEEVYRLADQVEATVYAIGFEGAGGGGSAGSFLKKIAGATGGHAYFPSQIGDVMKDFVAISEELQNHYVLGYTPKRPPDDTYRKIDLVVRRPGVHVRVRKGYMAARTRKGRRP